MKATILISLLSLLTLSGISQSIDFKYDASGNRIQRKLNIYGKNSGQDSLQGDSIYATQMKIKVYPNPAQDRINIELEPTQSITESKLVLYDINGKEMYTEVTSDTHLQVEVGNIAPGTYNLMVTRGEKYVMYTVFKK